MKKAFIAIACLAFVSSTFLLESAGCETRDTREPEIKEKVEKKEKIE
jgi:hypothetical protein